MKNAQGAEANPRQGLGRLWGQLKGAGRSRWLLLLGLLGVVLLAWGNLATPSSSTPTTAPTTGGLTGTQTSGSRTAPAGTGDEYSVKLEATLAETLSQVAGAGKVTVRVFLGSGPRYEYARKTTGDTRTTQETDRAGTSRVTSEQHEEGEVTVMRGQTGGQDQPVVVVTQLPEVQGVLVVASGAADPAVRAELTRAVQTALHLPPHRVQVLTKEANE